MKKNKENIEKKETPVEETPSVTSGAANTKNEQNELESCEVKIKTQLKGGLDESEFTPKAQDLSIKFEKTQTNVPVQTPSRQNFTRVHPDITFLLRTVKWEKDGKNYIVTDEAQKWCGEEVKAFQYFLSITPQGTVFLWPVQLDSEDDVKSPGKIWHDNDLKVVAAARDHWVKRVPNKEQKGYKEILPIEPIADPEWPDWTRKEIFDKAFQEFVIRDETHPVVKYLRGSQV